MFVQLLLDATVALKHTVRGSKRHAVRAVINMWNTTYIPTMIERNAIEKLEKLFETWGKLKKNSKRVANIQTANKNAVQADINKLFDITHANAMSSVGQEDQ